VIAYAQIEHLFLAFLSDTGQEYTIQRLVQIQKEIRQPERGLLLGFDWRSPGGLDVQSCGWHQGRQQKGRSARKADLDHRRMASIAR
jgi:hypothetical protein